jgi:hypothetical protein
MASVAFLHLLIIQLAIRKLMQEVFILSLKDISQLSLKNWQLWYYFSHFIFLSMTVTDTFCVMTFWDWPKREYWIYKLVLAAIPEVFVRV